MGKLLLILLAAGVAQAGVIQVNSQELELTLGISYGAPGTFSTAQMDVLVYIQNGVLSSSLSMLGVTNPCPAGDYSCDESANASLGIAGLGYFGYTADGNGNGGDFNGNTWGGFGTLPTGTYDVHLTVSNSYYGDNVVNRPTPQTLTAVLLVSNAYGSTSAATISLATESLPASASPEPGTWVICGAGMMALSWIRRKALARSGPARI